MKKTYAQESWWIPGLYLGNSAIHSQGVFTSSAISQGKIVIRWGGKVFSAADLQAGKAQQHTYVGIDNDLYLANPIDKPPSLDDFMNHSCNGNLWMADEVTLVARRDISSGEELTSDYALWLNMKDYKMKTICECKAAFCRHTITGLDWQLAEIQNRYANHFSPFINKLIQQQK
jgi:hypothetical protein